MNTSGHKVPKVGFVYAGSWEYAYPQYGPDFDQQVWCQSDDFIMKYPKAVMAHGVEPVLFYLSATHKEPAEFQHKYGFRMKRSFVRIGAGHIDKEFSLGILKAIAAEGCDLIHFYGYYRDRLLPDLFDLFALHARLKRLPFVCHYQVGRFPHTDGSSRLKKLLLAARCQLKRFAINSAERVFSLNHMEIERLTDPGHPEFSGYRLPADKLMYLPNIVDTEVFYPMDREEACSKLGLDPSSRYVLFAGFLRESKGIHHVIRVMPELLRTVPDTVFLVVGNGEYEEELRKLAGSTGASEHIRFIGPVPNSRLCPYYAAASVHVLPSYFESFGTVSIEALACNTPSIGANVGGIPEVLGNDVGILVSPGDEAALLAALVRVLRGEFALDPAKREEALKEYSYETAGRILHDEYGKILQLTP